jgi:hypothetical protein
VQERRREHAPSIPQQLRQPRVLPIVLRRPLLLLRHRLLRHRRLRARHAEGAALLERGHGRSRRWRRVEASSKGVVGAVAGRLGHELLLLLLLLKGELLLLVEIGLLLFTLLLFLLSLVLVGGEGGR